MVIKLIIFLLRAGWEEGYSACRNRRWLNCVATKHGSKAGMKYQSEMPSKRWLLETWAVVAGAGAGLSFR